MARLAPTAQPDNPSTLESKQVQDIVLCTCVWHGFQLSSPQANKHECERSTTLSHRVRRGAAECPTDNPDSYGNAARSCYHISLHREDCT